MKHTMKYILIIFSTKQWVHNNKTILCIYKILIALVWNKSVNRLMVLVVGNRKCSVIIALSTRNEWDFVDASLPKPDVTSASFKSWSRCNYMIISWRLGALSKSIGRIITYVTYAHQIWLDLEELYTYVWLT